MPAEQARTCAKRISECYRSTVESIQQIGDILVEAKVARDTRNLKLAKRKHASVLPASCATLHEITPNQASQHITAKNPNAPAKSSRCQTFIDVAWLGFAAL